LQKSVQPAQGFAPDWRLCDLSKGLLTQGALVEQLSDSGSSGRQGHGKIDPAMGPAAGANTQAVTTDQLKQKFHDTTTLHDCVGVVAGDQYFLFTAGVIEAVVNFDIRSTVGIHNASEGEADLNATGFPAAKQQTLVAAILVICYVKSYGPGLLVAGIPELCIHPLSFLQMPGQRIRGSRLDLGRHQGEQATHVCGNPE